MKYSLYTQDYSTFKRLKNENDFLLRLNQEEFIELISQSINDLKECLYTIISSDKTEDISLERIPNEDKINILLQEKLNEWREYDSIKDYKEAK